MNACPMSPFVFEIPAPHGWEWAAPSVETQRELERFGDPATEVVPVPIRLRQRTEVPTETYCLAVLAGRQNEDMPIAFEVQEYVPALISTGATRKHVGWFTRVKP